MTADPQMAQRLVQAREAAGFETVKDACARFTTWNYDTYIHHERGTRGFARKVPEYAAKYRVSVDWLLTGRGDMRPPPQSQNRDHAGNVIAFNDSLRTGKGGQRIPLQKEGVTHIVPVVGKVEAGAWREMSDQYDYEEVVEAELPEYQGVVLKAHYVEGTSINKFIEHGGKAVYVHPDDAIGGLQHDDYVVACKPNGAGQHEITIKQLVVRDDGTYELWPRSTDPRWQTPYIIPARREGQQDGVEIIGVVVDRRPPRIVRSGRPVPPNRIEAD